MQVIDVNVVLLNSTHTCFFLLGTVALFTVRCSWIMIMNNRIRADLSFLQLMLRMIPEVSVVFVLGAIPIIIVMIVNIFVANVFLFTLTLSICNSKLRCKSTRFRTRNQHTFLSCILNMILSQCFKHDVRSGRSVLWYQVLRMVHKSISNLYPLLLCLIVLAGASQFTVHLASV